MQVICLSAGTTVGHTASAKELLEDLASFKPTFLLVVPRIFEKVYAGAAHKAAAGRQGARSSRPPRRRRHRLLQGPRRRRPGHGAGPGLLLRARHAPLRPAALPQAAAGVRRPAGLHRLRRQPAELQRRPLLPRRRHPRPGRLRPDRNHGAVHGQHPGADQGGDGRDPGSRDHHPGRRRRRDPGQGHRRLQGLPRQRGGQRARRSWTASSAPATSAPLTRTAS